MLIPQTVWNNLPSSLQREYHAEPGGAADRSQPVQPQTNPASVAAGSDR